MAFVIPLSAEDNVQAYEMRLAAQPQVEEENAEQTNVDRDMASSSTDVPKSGLPRKRFVGKRSLGEHEEVLARKMRVVAAIDQNEEDGCHS